MPNAKMQWNIFEKCLGMHERFHMIGLCNKIGYVHLKQIVLSVMLQYNILLSIAIKFTNAFNLRKQNSIVDKIAEENYWEQWTNAGNNNLIVSNNLT